ncbi:hypothetical protein Desaci_4730 (plasmid) [Desulfosporosinus acidiphilus SJ4]|uniref:Uncharacterized protein n=1 Tax=Desulfosporosinus acidiphilus (strain DSM 22704 / JCM 16185 / SJ4) TaxID=646529 RepID=I4DCN3_DESAJ|nr:hypothetical protein [Desulfosporosinus acidiphilus]AFM43557.1 hypothetical protein Desaci_4730 [Desulfosporosinus acidiphilus SJ4]
MLELVISYLPFAAIALIAVSIYPLLTANYERLSKSQLKRVDRLFSFIDEEETKHRSFWNSYRQWLLKLLVELGYENQLGLFDSLVRSIFLFFLMVTFAFFYFSGSSLLSSVRISILAACFSFFLPHLVLIYLRSRHHSEIAKEYMIVANYISDALQGSQKDMYKAIDEGRSFVTIIDDALNRFLKRYLNQNLTAACDALMLEIPIPETEQFIAIISNGFEYRDRQNLMDYIQALNHTKHSMIIQAKEHKEKQREKLYALLVMIPAGLAIAITLSTTFSHVSDALTHITW